jgi:hypothetical protein
MPRHALTLADITNRGSASFRKLNAAIMGAAANCVGGIPSSITQQDSGNAHAGAHGRKGKGKASLGSGRRARNSDGQGREVGSGPRLRIHLTSFRRPGRELDDDNLRGGCKHLRDAIAAYFGLDDAERCIMWEYSQCETRGREGVGVKIETR